MSVALADEPEEALLPYSLYEYNSKCSASLVEIRSNSDCKSRYCLNSSGEGFSAHLWLRIAIADESSLSLELFFFFARCKKLSSL